MKNARGFSLVELMVTLAILVILVALAAPSFTTFIKSNRLTARANDIVTALNLARSEAIKRGATVNVTANGGSWGNGITIETGGEALRNFEAFTKDVTLTEAGGVTTIGYQANGMATTAATFSVCDSAISGENGRQVSVSATGRISTTTIVCN